MKWPFDQPRNCAVFTIRQIIDGECPIQVVYHDFKDAVGGAIPTPVRNILSSLSHETA